MIIEPSAIDETAAAAQRLAKGKKGRMPEGSEWAYVYDVISTMATVDALRRRTRIAVPGDVRVLVETATHPDALQVFAERHGWRELWQETWGSRLAQRQRAQGGLLNWDQPYMEQPVDEHVPTRLGESAVTVPLSPPIQSPFTDAEIDALAVPYGWIGDVPKGAGGVPVQDSRGWRIDVGGLTLRYGRMGLARV
jgi:CRISPR-associated endonuclease/helicase Cas3